MSAATTNNPVHGKRHRRPGEPFTTADLTDAQLETLGEAWAICKPYSKMPDAYCPHYVVILRDLSDIVHFGVGNVWAWQTVLNVADMIETWRNQGMTESNAERWQLLVRDITKIIAPDFRVFREAAPRRTRRKAD